MKSKRKQNLQEVLTEFYNCETDEQVFANFDYLSDYTLNIGFIKEQLENIYFVLPPPVLREKTKYKFVGTKPPYQRNLAYYDQMNFIERRVKESYFPRQFLADIIDENNEAPRLAKIRLNTIVNKFYPNNKLTSVFAFSPQNIEYKEVRNSGIIDFDEEGQLLSMNSYKISNKLTPTKILQVENAKNNQFLVRTYYRSYRCKLADPLEETKEPFEVLNQINFPGEVYNCLSSPFFEEKHLYLYGNNELAIIDDNKPSSVVIDVNYLSQNVPRFNDKHVFELMDSSYHPSIFLLSNLRMTTLYDIREKEMRLLVNGQQLEELKITYALKYLGGQFFATSNEQHLCIYDLRYPEKPVYSFLNLCDENPPNVLEISEPYDPFNTDCIGDADGLVSVLENLDIDSEITDLSNERILYGFSTLKNGSALLFPNKIFERLETDRDKYFTQTEKDCYLAHLEALDLKIGNFSYLNFNKYNHPKMLFTSNILDSQFRIRGLKVTHFGKDLLVQGTDNDNNMIFHVVRENQGEYRFMPMPCAEDAGTKNLDMWIHLKNKIENKIYKQESPSIFKEEIQIDPEKIIKMIPDTLDDVSN